MNSDVATVDMNDSLESVINRPDFQENSFLLVVAKDRIVGVVPGTRLKRGKGCQNGQIILDVLKLQSITARPGDSIRDGFLTMRKHGLTCLPIAERGTIHGFVTFGDLFNYMKATKL